MKAIFVILGILESFFLFAIPISIYVNHTNPDLINETKILIYDIPALAITVLLDKILHLITKNKYNNENKNR